jgi:hypothetical protein
MTEYEGTWEEIAVHASEFQGHRLRLTVLSREQPTPLSLQGRRAFLKLPLAERRRLLAKQAEQMAAYTKRIPSGASFSKENSLTIERALPKRGEIWRVNFDPTIGAEIRKTRPAIVVSSDSLGKLPLKLIAPVTSWNDAFAPNVWHFASRPVRRTA